MGVRQVALLSTAGACLDRPAQDGWTTPLVAAMAGKHVAVVRFLESVGAAVGEQAARLFVHPDFSAPSAHIAADGQQVRAGVSVTTLIPADADGPGAGSVYVDGAFSDDFLARLHKLFESLPESTCEKESKRIICSKRRYYCDDLGWVRQAIADALRAHGTACVQECVVTRAQRTAAGKEEEEDSDDEEKEDDVSYVDRPVVPAAVTSGAVAAKCLAPFAHMRFLDYSQAGGVLPTHQDLRRSGARGSSTHTFILYLADCAEGGETALVESPTCDRVLAMVKPRRGRLFVFPHQCWHQGREVVDVPKLLLRGECLPCFIKQ